MTRTASPPAKSPKWRRRPEHRPQQIIEAALEVFGECGLAKSRLQDIANRAGVSKGTIYLYFPNKEELFREMIRQTSVAAIAAGEQATAGGTATDADEVVARLQKMLSGIIRRGVESGEFRDIDPMVAARMLMALTVMNAIWRDEHTGVPLLCHKKDEEVFRELAHFYLHSLMTTDRAHAQADGAPADPASFITFDND